MDEAAERDLQRRLDRNVSPATPVDATEVFRRWSEAKARKLAADADYYAQWACYDEALKTMSAAQRGVQAIQEIRALEHLWRL